MLPTPVTASVSVRQKSAATGEHTRRGSCEVPDAQDVALAACRHALASAHDHVLHVTDHYVAKALLVSTPAVRHSGAQVPCPRPKASPLSLLCKHCLMDTK